jgi:two-component system alkaline phosphatase synthesis response regulator PhoP
MVYRKHKVLIAEDERDIRNLVVYTLEWAGFEVVEASDGPTAIEKALQEHPDLILLDVRMPGMNGYEVCAALKESQETHDIPVAFLSAKGQEPEIREGLRRGAEEYIVKPFAPDELHRRVANILQRAGKV